MCVQYCLCVYSTSPYLVFYDESEIGYPPLVLNMKVMPNNYLNFARGILIIKGPVVVSMQNVSAKEP